MWREGFFFSSSVWGCGGLGLGPAELCCGAAAGPLEWEVWGGLPRLVPFLLLLFLFLLVFFLFSPPSPPSKVSLPVSRGGLGRDWQGVPKGTERRGCGCPGGVRVSRGCLCPTSVGVLGVPAAQGVAAPSRGRGAGIPWRREGGKTGETKPSAGKPRSGIEFTQRTRFLGD